jgi:4-amino-4-deoxy-L-arabinose transferase-like glycosyltransferase
MLLAEPPITAKRPSTAAVASAGRAHAPVWLVLTGILVLGGVLRLALVWWFHGQPLAIDDERHYTIIAENLARFGEFAHAPGRLTSLRPPLYPAMVSAVYAMFGVHNHDAVRLLQVIIGLATVALTYHLAKRMYTESIGLWAAGLVCFYPSLVGTTCLILTETLFTFLVVLFAVLVASWSQTRSQTSLVAMGVVLGLASLTRSVLWLFPPFLLIYLILATRGEMWTRRLATVAIPILAFAVTLAPWSIRNTRLQQTFIAVDVMGGRNFMMGNYEHTPLYRAWDAISIAGEQSWDSVLARAEPGYRETTQGQRDKMAMRYGLRYAFAHPEQTVRRTLIKFCNFWQLERELVAGAARGSWGVTSRFAVLTLAIVVAGFYATAMILSVFGFVLTRPNIRGMSGFMLLLIAFVCLVHSAVFGHSRYHLPLMPLVLIYSAAAIGNASDIWSRRNIPAFKLASLIAAALVGMWIWELTVVEAGRLAELI